MCFKKRFQIVNVTTYLPVHRFPKNFYYSTFINLALLLLPKTIIKNHIRKIKKKYLHFASKWNLFNAINSTIPQQTKTSQNIASYKLICSIQMYTSRRC